ATLREGCIAQAVRARAVIVRDASGSVATIAAGAVLIASGIDAPQLIPELPVVPRKGHLLITERYPSLCHSQLVELGYLHSAHTMSGTSVAFNVQPRATGQLLIGSSRELIGREPGINATLLRDMLRRAIEFLPGLAGCAAVRAWTGFRPATPDKLPLIGKWDAMDGVWIAAGHEGLGITMAPGTAEMIVSLMMGRTPPVDPLPFSPTRVLAASPARCAE
ncbi:MAG: NAD(P)/FAD-dependent oxidoreductase, partial [Gemmatimonadaceae bacterium]